MKIISKGWLSSEEEQQKEKEKQRLREREKKVKKIIQDVLRAVCSKYKLHYCELMSKRYYRVSRWRTDLRLCVVYELSTSYMLKEEDLLLGLEIDRITLASNIGTAQLDMYISEDFAELYADIRKFLSEYKDKNEEFRLLINRDL